MEDNEIPSEHQTGAHHAPVHHNVHPAQHHPVHHEKSPMNPWMLISVLLAILLLVSLYMNYSLVKTALDRPAVPAVTAPTGTQPTAPTGNQAAPTPPAAPIKDIKLATDDHVKGDKTAKVLIVEYSDFQCPFCGKAEPTVKQILDTYGKDVVFAYRHFPLSFHPNARPAALASECANEQGKFWEYHGILYENQGALTKTDLLKYADDLKLDATKFKACIDSDKYAKKVDADFASGQASGVTGTPAFFINGELIAGAYPFDSFKAIIDKKLAAT